jgi:hypothetical protein
MLRPRRIYRHHLTDWREHAKCDGQDTERWAVSNLPRNDRARQRAAAELCRGCPVELDCAIEAWNTDASDYVYAGLAGSTGGGTRPRRNFRTALSHKIGKLLRALEESEERAS